MRKKFIKLVKKIKNTGFVRIALYQALLLVVLFLAIIMPDIYGKINEHQILGNINITKEDYSDEKLDSDLEFAQKINILNSSDVTYSILFTETLYSGFQYKNKEANEKMCDIISELERSNIIGMGISDTDISDYFTKASYVLVNTGYNPLEGFYAWYVEFASPDYTYYIFFDAVDYTVYKVTMETVQAHELLLTEKFTGERNLNDSEILFGEFLNEYAGRLNNYYGADECIIDYTYNTGAKLYITYNDENEKNTFPIYFELAIGDAGYAAFNMMVGNNTLSLVSGIAKDAFKYNMEH